MTAEDQFDMLFGGKAEEEKGEGVAGNTGDDLMGLLGVDS